MNKNYKKYVNKIGYVDNKHLKGLENEKGGHYIIIKEVDIKNGTISANVITSLEDKNRKIIPSRINKVKRGFLYSIPYADSNLPRWSAINLDTIFNVPIKKIDFRNRRIIKKRHYFFFQKFAK